MDLNETVLGKIADDLANLRSEGVQQGIKEALDAGLTPRKILRDGLNVGMETVGRRYEEGEYFLSELIMAAAVMNEGMETLRPHLKEASTGRVGRALIGTVEGDLHDIGKNIVVSMLESAGFQVTDLGIDVSPERFLEAVRKEKPDLVCMSTLLSVTMFKVKETVDRLEEAGLRKGIKILVGGRCLNEEIASKMGADAFGKDAWDAVNKAKQLLEDTYSAE